MNKQIIPPCYELATKADNNVFILPYMNPDLLDEFVTFLHLRIGIKMYQYAEANAQFRKSIYRQFIQNQKNNEKN